MESLRWVVKRAQLIAALVALGALGTLALATAQPSYTKPTQSVHASSVTTELPKVAHQVKSKSIETRNQHHGQSPPPPITHPPVVQEQTGEHSESVGMSRLPSQHPKPPALPILPPPPPPEPSIVKPPPKPIIPPPCDRYVIDSGNPASRQLCQPCGGCNRVCLQQPSTDRLCPMPIYSTKLSTY